jgi:hypothetical protein
MPREIPSWNAVMARKSGSKKKFVVASSHPYAAAHRWLDALLNRLNLDAKQLNACYTAMNDTVRPELDREPAEFRTALLKACLERLPWHREQYSFKDRHYPDYANASLLYEIACYLYRCKLPYGERDLCELLTLSKHD